MKIMKGYRNEYCYLHYCILPNAYTFTDSSQYLNPVMRVEFFLTDLQYIDKIQGHLATKGVFIRILLFYY